MEAFVFPEHSEWTQEFAKMSKLDRLGTFRIFITYGPLWTDYPEFFRPIQPWQWYLGRFEHFDGS